MTRAEQRTALDAFLADNPELHQLTGKLSTFNLFDVLRAANNELRHSNVLAWLMTPGESHGFGDQFLRRFLSRCLLANQERSLADVPMSAADVELADLSGSRILRERHHIDLLVVVPSPHDWVFIIENKVHSSESKGQLRRYSAAAAEEFPDSSRVGIFLTLDGQEASSEGKQLGYIPFSHQSVADLLTELMELHPELSSSVRLLLTHYLQTIRRLTMSDPEIVALCQTIYQRHRKAIDLIMEYGASSRFAEHAQGALNDDWTQENLRIARQDPKTNSVWFVPSDWMEPLKKFGPGGWGKFPFVVGCYFYQKTNGDSTQLAVEVGPIDDHSRRVKLLQELKVLGFKIADRSLSAESKYTLIYSASRKRVEGEDQRKVCLDMLKRAAPKFKKIGRALEECTFD